MTCIFINFIEYTIINDVNNLKKKDIENNVSYITKRPLVG